MPINRRSRVVSVDFWRGIALATIFIDHVPGNVLEHYTQRNFGFSDAAEVFVLLAGVAASFAYLPHFEAGERAHQRPSQRRSAGLPVPFVPRARRAA